MDKNLFRKVTLEKVQVKSLACKRDSQVWKYIIKFIISCHISALKVIEEILVKSKISRVEVEKKLSHKGMMKIARTFKMVIPILWLFQQIPSQKKPFKRKFILKLLKKYS